VESILANILLFISFNPVLHHINAIDFNVCIANSVPRPVMLQPPLAFLLCCFELERMAHRDDAYFGRFQGCRNVVVWGITGTAGDQVGPLRCN
jgi:hypothetical protein